eukprot:5822838-Amphidinium_carterae.1
MDYQHSPYHAEDQHYDGILFKLPRGSGRWICKQLSDPNRANHHPVLRFSFGQTVAPKLHADVACVGWHLWIYEH